MQHLYDLVQTIADQIPERVARNILRANRQYLLKQLWAISQEVEVNV